MQVCYAILTVVYRIVRFVIEVVRWVTETVCEWVSRIVETVKEVTEKVCEWLPWPLDKVCDWVTRVITVIEVVWEWVCTEIVRRIVDYVEVFVVYVFYVLEWVCWVIDWIPRFFLDLLWCLLGANPRRAIDLCVKVIVDSDGTPGIELDRVAELIEGTRQRFAQCNIDLCVSNVELVEAPDRIRGFDCGVGGLVSEDHIWFQNSACLPGPGANKTPVTVYAVKQLNPGKGCGIPGTNYVVIDEDASLATLAHEIGHLADLWKHSDDPNNVMHSPTSDDSEAFTETQCCVIRSSRYVGSATLHRDCRATDVVVSEFATRER